MRKIQPQPNDIIEIEDNELNREDDFFKLLIGGLYRVDDANDEKVYVRTITSNGCFRFSAWLARVRVVCKARNIINKTLKELSVDWL